MIGAYFSTAGGGRPYYTPNFGGVFFSPYNFELVMPYTDSSTHKLHILKILAYLEKNRVTNEEKTKGQKERIPPIHGGSSNQYQHGR